MICKNFKDKEKMRAAGCTAATILDRLCSFVKPGMNTWEIDEEGGSMMRDFGVKSAAKVTVRETGSFLLTPVFRSMMKWCMELD